MEGQSLLYRKGISIDEFCSQFGISRGFFYKLQAVNDAPPTMKLGRRIIIDPVDVAAWAQERKSRP